MKPALLSSSSVALFCVIAFCHAQSTGQALAAAQTRSSGNAPVSPASTTPATKARSRAEVEALIAKAGTTAPEWWNNVQLKYPPALNLTWDDTGKQWNPQKNLGQYIWDIINPNPSRWREGVRLLHYVLTVNKDNPQKLLKTAEALARMSQDLLHDWARAAFWWRKSAQLGKHSETYFALELGECYWKLGNREMCVGLISRLEEDDTRNGNLIKLWADLGDVEKALKLARDKAEMDAPDPAFLAAGDACRLAGRYPQALQYYRAVLALNRGSNDMKRNKERAAASIEAIRVFDNLDLKRIPDGAYRSSSLAYNGPLQVEVAVRNARIESVKVIQHTEKQFYSAITDTTAQIIDKQGVKGVDMTSGATITAEAIVNATAKALASGMK